MVFPDRLMPSWVNKWLIFNIVVLTIDGSFCVLRPLSLPGGALETLYLPYKAYIQYDKHYADQTDTFIFTQGLGNLIEAFICLLVVLKVFGTVRLNKMITIFCSVMTCYKTVLFCVYSLDYGKGGRACQGLVGEFFIFGLGSIWLIMPAYVTWVLLQDFVDITGKPKGSPSKSSPKKETSSADDSLNGSRTYDLRKLNGSRTYDHRKR